MQRTMNQSGFKFAMDKPLPEQHQGSLTGKLFHYRHQDLKVGQAIKVLESLLGSVETQMMSQPVFQDVQSFPKKYFDDHFIEQFSRVITTPEAKFRVLRSTASSRQGGSRNPILTKKSATALHTGLNDLLEIAPEILTNPSSNAQPTPMSIVQSNSQGNNSLRTGFRFSAFGRQGMIAQSNRQNFALVHQS